MGGVLARRDCCDATDSVDSSMLDIRSGFCNADPITREGKKIQMSQMLCVPLIPILLLVAEVLMSVVTGAGARAELGQAREGLTGMDVTRRAVHALGRERAAVCLHAACRCHAAGLEGTFAATDAALAGVEDWAGLRVRNASGEAGWPSDVDGRPELVSPWGSRADFEAGLARQRAAVRAGAVESEACLGLYTPASAALLARLSSAIQRTLYLGAWSDLLALQLLAEAVEYTGLQTAAAVDFFSAGRLDDRLYALYIDNLVLGDDALKLASQHSPLPGDANYTARVGEMRACVIHAGDCFTRYNVTTWTERMTSLSDDVDADAAALLAHIATTVEEDHARAASSVKTDAVILALVLLIAPVMMFLVYRMTSRIQEYAVGLSEKTKELRREKKKSDELLYQMLPKSVALQLKLSKRVSAESYNQVTIFFSDVVGFTSLSGRSTPMQVVDFLNALYLLFDTTIEHYDVYKVETIGDAYMIASGLPQRNGRRHVGEIAGVAMELLDGINTFKIAHLPEEKLKLRIGLHVGPVVAGVVGSKMPRYCLFGETVNIASSMESNGVPQKIHISADCKDALADLGGYKIQPRGIIEIKGKGEMETYFLIGKENRVRRTSVSNVSVSETPILNGIYVSQS